ncbi:DUF423 domain-containing protein [Rehaibacterium terrae]|jgi:uncharacterized membrane protein YgdD (TMEM256/DUF423 family)|uniref:Uncharacterized membrane protein YgdD (TMEM256/DUF423 family) n=1 Tax=Rehaibacterium terrae TaxID=1341696 RepID=A0A7W7V6T3_9GAMM|nr:DUF423 domain-containing protein [Rehaibacterium terrae]MBB5014246.1 uncharacterized membrane protein YgdD (TMEM256/DUF423 family) [Rehaibacterium terrae]
MPLPQRLLTATGAIACGLAVALGAYASHGVDGEAQARLGLAALFAFGHGLALVALAPRAAGWLALSALAALLAGMLLFAGSLALAVFAGTGTAAAPFGGVLMMLGWWLLAVAALVRRD